MPLNEQNRPNCRQNKPLAKALSTTTMFLNWACKLFSNCWSSTSGFALCHCPAPTDSIVGLKRNEKQVAMWIKLNNSRSVCVWISVECVCVCVYLCSWATLSVAEVCCIPQRLIVWSWGHTRIPVYHNVSVSLLSRTVGQSTRQTRTCWLKHMCG